MKRPEVVEFVNSYFHIYMAGDRLFAAPAEWSILMNNQFIQGVLFDWDKIDNDSYLKKIEAFHGVEKLEFTNPITFFVGENGSGIVSSKTTYTANGNI